MNKPIKVKLKQLLHTEALQYKDDNLYEIADFAGGQLAPIERRPDYVLKIKTPHGYRPIEDGDWVIKFVDQSFEVLSDEEFKTNYARIESPEGSDGL